MFRHAEPRTLTPLRLIRELGKFYLYAYPLFRIAVS